MSQAQKHLDLLGHKVKCKTTGFIGVVASVSFDLYGCIHALVHPGTNSDGHLLEPHWMDVSRLEVKTKKPVMNQPDFVAGPVAEGLHGPAEKPLPSSY